MGIVSEAPSSSLAKSDWPSASQAREVEEGNQEMGHASEVTLTVRNASSESVLPPLNPVNYQEGMSTEDKLFLLKQECAMCMQLFKHLSGHNRDPQQLSVKLNTEISLAYGQIQQQAWESEDLREQVDQTEGDFGNMVESNIIFQGNFIELKKRCRSLRVGI